jgi:hypothetical protein
MSSWGNNDNAANTPLWAAMQVKRKPDSTNTTLLFANTTADAFITGETIGVFGVDAQESAVNHGAHTGWVLRTVGSGGRAGRVQEEVLVAMNTMNTDGDGQTYANVSITFGGPSNQTVRANTANANTAVFNSSVTLKGNTAATLTYQWQVDTATGSLGWTNVANATPSNTTYTGGTSAALTVYPYAVDANTYVYRVVVTAADEGVTATSANATLTVL